jgi:L-ascorbate metabolism protein UlaG (beta-lactamase superfamily)
MWMKIGIPTFLMLSMNLSAQQSTAVPPPSSANSTPGSVTDNKRPSLDVTYIGNAGFMIQAGGKKVLVDALFEGTTEVLGPSPELLAQMMDAHGPFADVDLVLVTHPHSDHFNAELTIKFLRHHAQCKLVAHTQVVDRLRNEAGFAQIEQQIHEVKQEPGAYEHLSLNGINLDVICLNHMSADSSMRNLAFIVEMGGARFLHMGDSFIEQSEAHLNSYPFDRSPVDLLFLNRVDRSETARKFIAEKIKPSQIVAMHILPAELAERTNQIHAVYPQAIIFKQSMERRSIAIEFDTHE